MSRNRLLYVEWEDSCSHAGAWTGENELRKVRPARCHTVGWVVNETSKHMTLASSWGGVEGNRQYSGDMTIPKSVIRKKRRL